MSERDFKRYESQAQQRLIKILRILAGHEVDGLANGEIAKCLGIRPADVTNHLANLYLGGIAEEIPDTGRWRLTPWVSQAGFAMAANVERRKRKLDEIHQRYSRH